MSAAVTTGPGGTIVRLQSPQFAVTKGEYGRTRITFEGFEDGVTVEVEMTVDDTTDLLEEIAALVHDEEQR